MATRATLQVVNVSSVGQLQTGGTGQGTGKGGVAVLGTLTAFNGWVGLVLRLHGERQNVHGGVFDHLSGGHEDAAPRRHA